METIPINRRTVILNGAFGAGVLVGLIPTKAWCTFNEDTDSLCELSRRAEKLEKLERLLGVDQFFELTWLSNLLGIDVLNKDPSTIKNECLRKLVTPDVWDAGTFEVVRESMNYFTNRIDSKSYLKEYEDYQFFAGGDDDSSFRFVAEPSIAEICLVNYQVCCRSSSPDKDGKNRIVIANLWAHEKPIDTWTISDISRFILP